MVALIKHFPGTPGNFFWSVFLCRHQ